MENLLTMDSDNERFEALCNFLDDNFVKYKIIVDMIEELSPGRYLEIFLNNRIIIEIKLNIAEGGLSESLEETPILTITEMKLNNDRRQTVTCIPNLTINLFLNNFNELININLLKKVIYYARITSRNYSTLLNINIDLRQELIYGTRVNYCRFKDGING